MGPRTRTPTERREAAEARRARRAAVTDPDVVIEAAAAFLAARSRSIQETRRRLVHLGYPAGLVVEVVERLVELGYLDDVAFARAWVESRDRARPRGAIALRRELQGKGVADDIIRDALAGRAAQAARRSAADEAPPDADRAAAERLIERRSASLGRESDPRRRRQKAYALLARHGFTPDVCHEVASAVSDEPSEPV